MTYEFYKTLHFFGLILTFTSLIASFGIIYFSNAEQSNPGIFKKFSIGHGIGLVIILVSGFGLAARLGYMSQLPTWVYFKIALWLVAGGIVAIIKRKKLSSVLMYTILIAIPVIGSIIAVNKPF